MIVVSGEALMDVFAGQIDDDGLDLHAYVGGSPFNVAVGLARLGQPSALFAGISTGFLGERLMVSLSREGVDCRCIARLDAPTTLSLVGADAKGIPSYSFYGHGAADRLLRLAAMDQVPAAAAYQFGSYAMVVEPVAGTLRALVERECRRSLISYDPNIRLNVEPEVEVWRRTLAWMVPRTQLLKVSQEDLDKLFPGRDGEALAQEWLAAGVSLVVVTRGEEGAWARVRGSEPLVVPPMAVSVVDTVGAGDSFQAALLTALAERRLLSQGALKSLRDADLAACLHFAAQAAAITCSRRGADLPRRSELPSAPLWPTGLGTPGGAGASK
jgi:fructokinase